MGKVNTIETLGALDGPGIRTVIFFQGCHLRCSYCHNPDMWDLKGGQEVTAEQIGKLVKRYIPYYGDKGGVTFSGGDPLAQPEFLLECLKVCKAIGVHTTLDTAGCGNGDYDEILKYTDLVILDIKHENNEKYQKITGRNIDGYLKFKEALIRNNTPIWIKHVVVPGLTDQKTHIKALKKEIFSFKNILKVELLPYHTMGTTKYENLGLAYKLKGYPEMDKDKLKTLQSMILKSPIEFEEEQ